MLAGQVFALPLHTSARSQTSAAARQTVPEADATSAGHEALLPVQVSAASQRSVAARQTVPDAAKPSAGQAALLPVQVSATSQPPADARQVVPEAAKPSAGQVVATPLHVSATSHTPVDARHVVPDGIGAQVPDEPARLHAWQSEVPPAQALLQQTPSVQNPVAHWFAAVQAPLTIFGTHWLDPLQ